MKVEPVAKIICSLPNQKRFERFELVRQLREDGLTISAIANQIPLDRKTIRKYLNTDRFPDWYGTDSPKRVSKLAPYKDYLLSHGLDGHRTVRQLWRDIQEQGFTGSLSIWSTEIISGFYNDKALQRGRTLDGLCLTHVDV